MKPIDESKLQKLIDLVEKQTGATVLDVIPTKDENIFYAFTDRTTFVCEKREPLTFPTSDAVELGIIG